MKRSDFYRLRHKIGLGDKRRCAELLGVTARSISNYDHQGGPIWATRLLSLYDHQDLSGIGPDWAGFAFSRGVLIHGRLRLRWTPEGLKHWPDTLNKLSRYEAEESNPRCPYLRLIAWIKERLVKMGGSP